MRTDVLEHFGQPKGEVGIRDALGFGWRTLMRRLPFFAAVIIAVKVGYRGLNLAESWLGARVPWAGIAVSTVDWVLWVALSIAFIRISLRLVDGTRPALSDLRSTPATFFRFAIASLSYTLGGAGLLLLGCIAALAIVANFLDYRSSHGHFSLPVSVGTSALGAAACFGGFRVGRWLIDRQLYGHLIVDRYLGPAAAFRGSGVLARTARWLLLGVTSLLLGIEVVLGMIVLLTMDHPPVDPRVPWRFPHITTGWPPLANSALTEVLSGLAALDVWFLLLTLSFIYRKLADHSLSAIAPEWYLQNRAVVDRNRT